MSRSSLLIVWKMRSCDPDSQYGPIVVEGYEKRAERGMDKGMSGLLDLRNVKCASLS